MDAFKRVVETVIDLMDDRQLDNALMESVQRRLNEVADAVATVRPLAELPDSAKRDCAKTSAVKWCPARSVVYDEDRDSGEANGYFVLEGKCTCVQRLHVRKTTAFGRDRFELVRKRHCEPLRSQNVQTFYVKISDLRAGSVFGLGERRSGRLVIATSDVKCLLVPLTFLTKHNASNIWGRIVCSLNGSNPTVEQSFRELIVEKRWEEYKKSLIKDVFRKRELSR